MSDTATYVIQLEGNRYYVGKTTQLKERLTRHFKGQGAKCCKQYQVIGVVEVLQGDLEKETFYRYQDAGYDVRGHAFTYSF